MNNENVTTDELPELSDEDIEIVHEICKRASTSAKPPFKALFAAYDHVFAEQGIEQQHDGVVFRLLLLVGEAARMGQGRVDLVRSLKDVLQSQGITVIDNDGAEIDEVTRSVDAPMRPHGLLPSSTQLTKRRVSFDDARLDETRLSDRALYIQDADAALDHHGNLLSQPPWRGRLEGSGGGGNDRRARSTSSRHHNLSSRQPAPKHAPPSAYNSDHSDHDFNPTLLFQPSQTQLELNAEAFLSTSALRSAREALHVWHKAVSDEAATRRQAWLIASAHDTRTLLKQALDQWRATLASRIQERRHEAHWDRVEERIERAFTTRILEKAFTHWATLSRDQKLATTVAQKHMLKIRYFRRWRVLALDTSQRVWKVQSILARQLLSVWREKVLRRQLRDEQALAFCEERAVQKSWRALFWHFCSRSVEGWHEQKSKARVLASWHSALGTERNKRTNAQTHCDAHTARLALTTLRTRLGGRLEAQQLALAHHDRSTAVAAIKQLALFAKHRPIYQAVQLKVTFNLQRKAFRIWHLQLRLTREAADVDRKRVLQGAWTCWNDALRTKAIGQRIDERVLVESLYKWVLQERLRLVSRARHGRSCATWLAVWHSKLVTVRGMLGRAESAFTEDQRRRTLAMGMVRLNLALRRGEDAERAALEMRNSRLLPGVLVCLQQKTARSRELHKWAQDARFYTLCTRALRVLQERTIEHQQNRRRNSYARVRARVKIRLVGLCFNRWREQCTNRQATNAEAERRAQNRLFIISTQAFDRWREKTAQLVEIRSQAEALDKQKLLGSALAALTIKSAALFSLNEQAVAFKRETDFALGLSALKKIQWQQFTGARRTESADALWARNRDAHIRSMLRVWVAQASSRRAERNAPEQTDDQDEPGSPSLRPASRARSRSSQRIAMSSPPQQAQSATPAYLRTPSRSRKAGRFRQLATPAPVTPFAFDQSYLVTTPAPLPAAAAALDMDALPAQITPFSRKLRAGGFASTPKVVGRSLLLDRSTQGGGGTAKSVRFVGGARSRFQGAGSRLKDT